MSKWFEPQSKKTKETKEKDLCTRAVPTTALVRICESAKLTETSYGKNNLYASNIGDPDLDLHQELVDFWTPQALEPRVFSKELYCEQSNVKHSIWQEFLHSAGVTHSLCNNQGKFQEPRCLFEEYGISGRIDLILPDSAYLKALGAKTPKDKFPKIEHWLAADIKETDEKRQKEAHPEILSEKYLTQISLYIKWLYDKGIGHKTKGAFLYLNRNMPLTPKYFEVTIREDLIEKAFKKADCFWQWVRSRKLPKVENATEWIEEQIALQPKRQWNKLAEIAPIKQKELDFGEGSNE